MLPGNQYVLICDDDAELRERLAEWFAGQGCAVRVAGSGEAAVSLAEQAPGGLGVLVVDYGLPGMDGLSVVTEVRRRVGRPFLPAVMITGSRNVHVPSGVSFVQKPFLLVKLGATVRAAIASSGLIEAQYRLVADEWFHRRLAKLDPDVQRALRLRLSGLLHNPRPPDVLWVGKGEYRVVGTGFWVRYSVDDRERLLTPLDFGERGRLDHGPGTKHEEEPDPLTGDRILYVEGVPTAVPKSLLTAVDGTPTANAEHARSSSTAASTAPEQLPGSDGASTPSSESE